MAGLFESIIDNLGKETYTGKRSKEDGLKLYPKVTYTKKQLDDSQNPLPDGITGQLQDTNYGGTLMYDKGPYSAGVEYIKDKNKIDILKDDQTLFKDTTDNENTNFILGYDKNGKRAKVKFDKEGNAQFQVGLSFKDGGSTNGSGNKAFTAKVKELMDDGYEFGEAVKEAMRQGYAKGGITTPKRGLVDEPGSYAGVKQILKKGDKNEGKWITRQNNKAIYFDSKKDFEEWNKKRMDKTSAYRKSMKVIPSAEQELIAMKVYNKTMSQLFVEDRDLFNNIRSGKTTINSKATPKVEGQIKMTKDGPEFPNKKIEKEYLKKVRKIYTKPSGVIDRKTAAEGMPISKRVNERVINHISKKENLKSKQPKGEGVKGNLIKRNKFEDATGSKKVIKKIGTEKQKFLKGKPQFGLIDTAHRLSKSHAAYLGLQNTTRTIGMDSRLINEVVIKPTENMLNSLYGKRELILDEIKKTGQTSDLQKKQLKEINIQVKKAAKSTSGRLIGIVVNPNTLKPSFSGVKKELGFSTDNKTLKEIEKLPSSKRGDAYFKYMENNVKKSVSGEIKRGFVPNDFKTILIEPKNRNALLNYARKNTPDLFKKFVKVLDEGTKSGKFSKQGLRLYSGFPLPADPAMIGEVGAVARGALSNLFNGVRNIGTDIKNISKVDFNKMQLGEGKLAKAAGVAKNVVKVGGKILAPVGIGLSALEMKNMRDQGKSIPEIAAYPFFMDGVVADAQDRLKMTRPERQALMNEQIALDDSFLDTDFLTPRLQGVESVNTQMVKDRVAKERALEEENRRKLRNKTLPSVGIMDILTNSNYEV